VLTATCKSAKVDGSKTARIMNGLYYLADVCAVQAILPFICFQY